MKNIYILLILLLSFVNTNAQYSICDDPDSDGVINANDYDDDNDGILDSLECPNISTKIASLGPVLTNVSFHITSNDINDALEAHVLDSITTSGGTFSGFVSPDSFKSNYTMGVGWDTTDVKLSLNGVIAYNYSPSFDAQILVDAYQNMNLNAFISQDAFNYSSSNTELYYNTPIKSSSCGYFIMTERAGNGYFTVYGLDSLGNELSDSIEITPTTYVNTGARIPPATGTVYAYASIWSLEDLAPLGTNIYGIRIYFGPNSSTNAGDGKALFIVDQACLQAQTLCDIDNDGIPNSFDLDSDGDGCFDAVEGSGNLVTVTSIGQVNSAVNTDNGIPLVITSTQNIGSSQNPLLGSGSCVVLPIDDVEFYGRRLGRDNILLWDTDNEFGLKKFNLYHSKDGLQYQLLSEHESKGEPNMTASYKATHNSPSTGLHYYKLTTVDMDEKELEQGVVQLSIQDTRIKDWLNVYPNPVVSKIHVQIDQAEGAFAQVNLFDVSGRVVLQSKHILSPDGNARFDLGLDGLSQGIYFLEVEVNNFKEVLPITKKN